MKKILFLALLLTNSQRVEACGNYRVNGQVQFVQGLALLRVFPGTQSEIKLKLGFKDSAKLSAYMDQLVSAEILVTEADATSGSIEKIDHISRQFSSELSQSKGTSLQLLQSKACKKGKGTPFLFPEIPRF